VLAQREGDGDEDPVPLGMPAGVVDGLEVVDVDDRD
jgi:hypothetical protein